MNSDNYGSREVECAILEDVEINLSIIKKRFNNYDSFTYKIINKQPLVAIIYISNLSKKERIDKDIIQQLLPYSGDSLSKTTAQMELVTTINQIAEKLLEGNTILLHDGYSNGWYLNTSNIPKRSVEQTKTENAIRGSYEGFVEDLEVNLSLLRKRIKSSLLTTNSYTIGKITNTKVAVTYIESVVNEECLTELTQRINAIDLQGLIDSGQLEGLIQDSNSSFYPQVLSTERPDKVTANLLEGRICVLVNGSPYALVVPATYSMLQQASDDYALRWTAGSFLRILRFISQFLSLSLPAHYIAITMYHYEVIPLDLIIPMASSRTGLPFSALVEAFVMMFMLELLEEAARRLPITVGQTIGIVGALIIGQAAVQAKIVSNIMVIIVSITAISTFAVPNYNATISIRLLRYPVMAAAGFLGFFGLYSALMVIVIHLSRLESFGVPYFSPVAPFRWQQMRDFLMRAPTSMLVKRLFPFYKKKG